MGFRGSVKNVRRGFGHFFTMIANFAYDILIAILEIVFDI